MTFTNAIRSGLRNYFNFETRTTRREFWLFILFTALVYVGGSIVENELYPHRENEILTTLICVFFFLPVLSAIVRRLRDSGHGWENLFWLCCPWIGVWMLLFFCCEDTKAEEEPASLLK